MLKSILRKSGSVLLFSLFLPIAFASDRSCTPEFPYKNEWWGADAAYSIALPDGRDVWIFGDTMFGNERKVTGSEPRMIRNSIGVSTCKDGKWSIDYAIRKSATGKPLDFFQTRNRNFWYWALDGFYHENELFVTLLCIRSKPVSEGDPMGFETCGTDIARVSDLKADPQDWTMEYFPLVADGAKAYPSAAAVVDGEFAYIFALYESGSRPQLATRIPLAGLNDPQKSLQYLAKDDTWKGGFDPTDAKPIMEHGASELSVRYHPEIKKWVAVLMDPKMTGSILLRTAPDITGPWTEGEVIYRVPEMQKQSAVYDPDTFCYAGKEHPEYEQSGTIVFTYVCNTMKVPKLVEKLDIYSPKTIRVKLPKN